MVIIYLYRKISMEYYSDKDDCFGLFRERHYDGHCY